MNTPSAAHEPKQDEEIPVLRDVLSRSNLEVVGRLPGASNTTLLCTIAIGGEIAIPCVYKPTRGERPLWDFPDGTLGQREVCASMLADIEAQLANRHTPLLPPTVWREDGPYGPGSCQLWIEESETRAATVDVFPPDLVPVGWLSILTAEGPRGEPLVLAHADDERLRGLALLDIVMNNSDRKGGHILTTESGIQGIDHGLCFNKDDKLRTVLWGWVGSPLLPEERDRLKGLAEGVRSHDEVGELLAPEEVQRTVERIDALLSSGQWPAPDGHWPPVPWPAF